MDVSKGQRKKNMVLIGSIEASQARQQLGAPMIAILFPRTLVVLIGSNGFEKAGSIFDFRDDVPNPVEAGNRSLVVWPGGVVVRSLQPTAGMLLTNA